MWFIFKVKLQGFSEKSFKNLALFERRFLIMYRSRDRRTRPLFSELFPFGGSLNEDNRWLRIAQLIPWEEFEGEYAKYFSDVGRPAKDARLIVGLLLLKHMTGLSDEGVVQEVLENPYMQAFCGFEQFVTGEILDSSTLTKQRVRLGLEFFKNLEDKAYKVLIDRRIIKAKGMLVDATVFPEDIKYPNDVGLLNDVRVWLVGNIKKFGKAVGKRYRTYCRVARRDYLNFSKKRKKTKKAIDRAKRQMLQYVRRNIRQLQELIEIVHSDGREVTRGVRDRLHVAEEIYHQQFEMYSRRVNRIKGRIVSFHRPYVRPIKRGKLAQSVEFGAKGGLVHVDGFLFLDHLRHEAFAEDKLVGDHLLAYRERFGKLPPYFTADRKYGTRENRELLKGFGVRGSFRPLGRKTKTDQKNERWFKHRQKERNRIEGSFGNGKQHYGLNRVRYSIKDGSEIWVRGGILAMNLKTAAKRA
jgi:IS5 family transposase